MARLGWFVACVLAVWVSIVWLHDYTLGGGQSAASIAGAAAGAAAYCLAQVFRG